MNIDRDQKKWASGLSYKNFKFCGNMLYLLSVFICVHLCSSVAKKYYIYILLYLSVAKNIIFWP